MSLPIVLIIQGPTASGKTALAHAIAEKYPIEIISADSRQVYRGLDIGTAKPTEEERKRYRYHGIDLCAPTESISSGQFARWVWNWIAKISSRGNISLIVGGSGLYVTAITEGMVDEPASVPPAIRTMLAKRLLDRGRQALYEELQAVDPASAARYTDKNPRRLLRALEYYHAYGIPLSQAQKSHHQQPPPMQIERITLLPERSLLYERIADRVRAMWDAGLVEETQRLLQEGYDRNLPIFETIGYAEALARLEGKMRPQEAIERIILRTRRYAKRQITWLRHMTPLGHVLYEFGDHAQDTILTIIDHIFSHKRQ